MKRKPDIPCPNCGKYFHPRRPTTIFCCRECGIAYNKAHGKYKKSEETKAKLAAAHKGKAPWNKGRKMTREEIDKMKACVKAAWTEEKRKAQHLKQKEVWSNPELLAKHSKIVIESHNSEEVRNKTSEAVKRYFQSISQEELTRRYIKTANTRLANGIVNESAEEIEIRNYIESLGFKTTKYITGKGPTRCEIDVYIPELKFGIEYNGIYFHATNGINKVSEDHHYKKQLWCYEHEITILQIWEDQWEKNKDYFKALLKYILTDKTDPILDNIPDEDLVFSKIEGTNDYNITSDDKILFKHVYNNTLSKEINTFINTHHPDNIYITFDWSTYSPLLYTKLGFVFSHTIEQQPFYVKNSSTLQRSTSQNAFDKYYICYDAGKVVYKYNLNNI